MIELKRTSKTVLIGVAVALAGIIVFLSSDAISTSAHSTWNGQIEVLSNPDARDRDTLLWCGLAFTLVLSGSAITTAGLYAWCQADLQPVKQNTEIP
jgi:hypothetical protein